MDAATAARDHRVPEAIRLLVTRSRQHLCPALRRIGGKLGIRVLKSPPRRPMANAICECLIGTIRRECLDWLIPLSASHLRSFLKAWIGRYSSEYPASR